MGRDALPPTYLCPPGTGSGFVQGCARTHTHTHRGVVLEGVSLRLPVSESSGALQPLLAGEGCITLLWPRGSSLGCRTARQYQFSRGDPVHGRRRWGKQPGQLQSPQLSCSFYRASSPPTCPPPPACGSINLRSAQNAGQGGRQVLLCPRDDLFWAVPYNTQHTTPMCTYCIHTTLRRAQLSRQLAAPATACSAGPSL